MKRILLNAIRLGVVCSCILTIHQVDADQGPWPQWRGPERDDISEETGLLQEWPEGGPPRQWLFEDCGVGYGGPAIVDDRVYILGGRGEEELLLCLDAKNGQELWSVALGPLFINDWGDGPRSTPTIDGNFAYCMTAHGHLACVNIESNELVWKRTMEELGGNLEMWGFSESPLVHEGQVYCTPGGDQGALAALDKRTGDLVWQSSEITGPKHYSSIVLHEVHGRTTGVRLLQTEVVGFSLEDGSLLWSVPWPGRVAVIPTPIVWKACVYVTAGYGAGCMLIRIDDQFNAETVYENNVMVNQHGGAILLDDHVYGYSDGKGWVCQNIATGEMVWREREAFGKGALGYADNRFYCLAEDTGEVALIAASPDGWQVHGQFTLEPQTQIRKDRGKVWVHPVIADGRFYLRDQDLLFAFDVKAR